MLQVPESLFDAPLRRSVALNRLMFAIAHGNLRFGFELARAVTIFDVLKLQAAYWQRLLESVCGGELPNAPAGTGASGAPLHRDEAVTGEHGHPQQEGKAASRPVMATAPAIETKAETKAERLGSKPKDRRSPRKADTGGNAVRLATATAKHPSQPSLKRSAATRASAVERKTGNVPSKPKEHRPPSRRAGAVAGKRPARQDAGSLGRRVEIQFGRLDDSAVRFTSREAWRLQNGRWRRISVDRVLSEAVVLSKARFAHLFPKAPQLPAGAFVADRD